MLEEVIYVKMGSYQPFYKRRLGCCNTKYKILTDCFFEQSMAVQQPLEALRAKGATQRAAPNIVVQL